MKKKSMISALVLSVAMFGIGASSVMANDYTINDTSYTSGSANGGSLSYTHNYTDEYGEHHVTEYGSWNNGDKITISGSTLGISGYNGSSVVNGILEATGGTVNLTGGALTLGADSSVADGVTLTTASGTTLILNGGEAAIGGGDDNIQGNINAITGELTVNGTGVSIGTDSSVAQAVDLTVSGTLGLNGGTIHIGSGDSVTGTIAATSGNLRFHDTSTLDSHYNISGSTNVYNNGTLTINQNINTTGRLSNDATITNASTSTVGTLTNNGTINGSGSLTTTSGTNNGSITQSAFNVADNGNYNNYGSMTVDTLTVGTGATLNNSGVTDATTGNMVNASIVAQTIANNGEITLNNADLSVTSGDLGGTVSAVGGTSSLAVGGDFTGILNVGKSDVTGAILNVTQNNILPEANVHIFEGNTLNLGDPNTSVTAILGNGDTWDGDLNNHSNSEISIVDRKDFGTVGYSQDGTGVLNVTEGAAIRVKDASKITDGTINVASDATFASAANGFTVTDLNTAGTVNGINGGRENYNADTMTIGSAADPQTGVADTQADFQIDILGRSNRRNATDHFVADTIDPATGNTEGTINISDWALNGDIYGWEAPIDRHISLDNVFQGAINENIDITATNKETFTPIGWYKLNANPNSPGSYTLDLARYNPWVYRGQVTKIAQYQNQLAIDDMLFTHSMVLPSFKENDHGANASILANRYAASGSPLYAPYDYSRKDGGVWCKMYGNFEHLNMNRGLNVENNSFGALIGADLGLKELSGGWTFMPTAYVGYNGAHQNYARQGAWQNGGQAGFLGTWYKDNFIIGALVYGGVYNNEMDTPRGNDDAFNYFAGGSVKTAYNWRFHRDWVLQPNFLVAYNFFGKENWHTDFGQMSMMSGQLHGVNVAPGLNLIWEKETFSAYATLQYMYNVNQSVGGRAGNVNLPHIHMDRGYIQYGLGFNKRFGDRFSGYLQAVFRNVGRTGVGFQGGFNFALGKNPSNYNATLKGHTPIMQKAKLKMSSSHS